jgi:hypothetical protein
MKKNIFTLILVSLLIGSASAQKITKKNDPTGKWKFEAVNAPEGFTSGTIDVGFAEKLYSVVMTFEGNGYSFPGEKVKFEKDSFNYSMYVDNQEVVVTLALIDPLKMEGKAVYSDGEVQLIMNKIQPSAVKK